MQTALRVTTTIRINRADNTCKNILNQQNVTARTSECRKFSRKNKRPQRFDLWDKLYCILWCTHLREACITGSAGVYLSHMQIEQAFGTKKQTIVRERKFTGCNSVVQVQTSVVCVCLENIHCCLRLAYWRMLSSLSQCKYRQYN